MADIFISYSKADRAHVVMLSAYLEAQGYTTWWDKNLTPGTPYRDEIMKQLAAARVAIVIWTRTSIKSDFVRAEAGQAKAAGKLIPVKEADVGYGDIPLPFGEMHTEDLGKLELIREAVVAVMARPRDAPPLWKRARFELLSWIAVLGAAVTLVSHLQGFLKLSLLSRYIVQYWTNVLTTIWSKVLFFLPRVSETDALMLSAISFTAGTLFLAPAKEADARARRFTSSAAWTALLFAILILIFATGTLYAREQSGFFYDATVGLLRLAGLEMAAFNRLQQAVLVVGLVLLCLAVGLILFVLGTVIVYRREGASHEANVEATSVRLHRILIMVVLLALLDQLSWPLEEWLRSHALL
jgi:hypothetical protein